MSRTFEDLPRADRRKLLSREGTLRGKRTWGPWKRLTFPRGTVGKSWASDFTIAHKNDVFSVLQRHLPGGVMHLAVSSLSGIRPTWWEMQRIKNELAGTTCTAVEIYPPQSEVIDEADMYHIWVLPEPLPFGLYGEPDSDPLPPPPKGGT